MSVDLPGDPVELTDARSHLRNIIASWLKSSESSLNQNRSQQRIAEKIMVKYQISTKPSQTPLKSARTSKN